ncbi:helix-turn-helix transcriptional regulator [Aureimonas mangrovi]|uniref:helix-turn-helix transcriptional regulator n=1 Tax=Aureimonas mangrovi TaxID=2758041 RepID=UPI00163DD285|nr:helix-turn-helix transcriptional regulator [Aureimonas mangrovi]
MRIDQQTFAEKLYGPLNLTGIDTDVGDGRRVVRIEIAPVGDGVGAHVGVVCADGRAEHTLAFRDFDGDGRDRRLDEQLEQHLDRYFGVDRIYWKRWVPLIHAIRRVDPKSERRRDELTVMKRHDDEVFSARLAHTEKLRRLIDMCGLSQAEAAGVLGISHNTMRQRLTGHRPSPDPAAEVRLFLEIWEKIEGLQLEGLPDGARKRAEILAYARTTAIR